MSERLPDCSSPEKRDRVLRALQTEIEAVLARHEIPEEAEVAVLEETLARLAVGCGRLARPRQQFLSALEARCRAFRAGLATGEETGEETEDDKP